MKKLSFFLWASIALIFLNFSNPTIAQPPPNLSLSEQMDYLMAPLDFTEVTSGLLLDKGFPMMEIAAYDGTTSGDTIKEYGDWFRQFGTMVTSKTGTTSPIGVTADYKPLADSLLKSGVIPIMVLHAEYHKFISDSTALSALITFQNNQLNDVAGRTSSPYELHEIVSFSPKQNKFYDKLSHDFRINADFIRTNVSKTISTIQIDFDNGSGYQTITLGSNSKITWSTFGKKILKLKITYTDSSVYHAKAQIELVDKSGGQPKYNSAWDDSVYIPHPTIANHGVGLAIEYGCGNNNELRKPFIYVEGFNPDLFGDQFYEEDFYTDFRNYELFQWPQGFPLLSELDENGYDVVYVDFERGDGSLIENAKVLQVAINKINELKAANCSSSDNILVGYSMGGVVARLALTYMEDDAEDHEVSYYVSVDSPHRGANVPRAVIAALIDIRNYHFAGFSVSEDVPAVEEAYQVLFSPAARQMLLYSGEGSNTLITGHGPSYTSFQNHLHNEQGMPTQTLQNIAVAKGGGTGVGQYGSMASIVDINTNTFNALGCFTDVPNVIGWFAGAFALLKLGLYAKVVIDINAMPGYVSNPLEIYERKIRLVATIPGIPIPYFYWDSHNTDAQYVNFYDGVQGGTYGLENFVDLEDEDDDLIEFINDAIAGDYEPCLSLDQSKFSFIPTVSALDMGDFIGGTGAVSPNVQIDPIVIENNGQTSFDKVYILDPTKYPSGFVAPLNESHLDLTPSNVFPFSTFIPPAFTTNAIGTIEGFTYNHGRAGESDGYVETSNKITRLINIGVNQAGTLCVNCTGVLDNSTLSTNPQNEADHFAVELTQNCGSDVGRLNIGANGLLKIGESNSKTGMLTVRENSWIELNDGIIEVREGSKLIIESGAELRLNGGQVKVYNGGEIIVKAGGLLIYEDGVVLDLNGNDAQLALGGHTHIGDDATFRFFWEGNEGGYVRLLEEGGTAERFSAGTNARIHLRGDGKDDLILYMENGTALWEYGTGVNIPDYPTLNSNYFERVLLSYGKVELENNAKIKLAKDGRFHGVHMQSFGAGGAHDVEAFRRCDILDSDLFNMRVQANLHILNTGRLAVSASNFYGGIVVVRGRYYQVDNSYFFQSSINSVDGSLASSVNYCEFDECDYAVTDLSVATLNVNGSHFHNGFSGIEKGLGPLNLKCNEFNDLNVAVLGYAKARVNLSTFHGAGYNHFWNNPVNIQLSYATDISLDGGYNQIYDGSSTVSNIEGILAHNSSIMCPPMGIAASHNTWTPHSAGGGPGYPDPNKFNVASHGGSGSSLLVCPRAFHFGVVAPVTACGEHDGPIRDPLEKSGTAKSAGQVILPLITSDTYYQETPLDEAIHMAMASSTLVDSLEGNNLVAADMFYELLHAEIEMSEPVNDSLAAVVASLRWQALTDYKGLVEYLFADSTLSIDANQSVFDLSIGNYASTLMHLTDSVKTETNYLYQFELEMLKAGLFRSINKPEMAYAILANVDFCEHDSLERAVLIVMLENIAYDISMQQYSLSEIMHASGSFELDSALLAAIVPSAIDTSAFGSYFADPEYVWFTNCGTWGQEKKKITSNLPASLMTIYPNPASSVLELQFGEGLDFNKGLFEFRLFDLGGKHLLTAPLQGATQMLQLPRLQSALYLGVVYQNGVAIHQEKVNIIQ